MDLDAEEQQLIIKHRRQKEAAARATVFHLLDVTSRFVAWMHENGAGSSYSTFCDDFGYVASRGESRPDLYKRVTELIEAAKLIVL